MRKETFRSILPLASLLIVACAALDSAPHRFRGIQPAHLEDWIEGDTFAGIWVKNFGTGPIDQEVQGSIRDGRLRGFSDDFEPRSITLTGLVYGEFSDVRIEYGPIGDEPEGSCTLFATPRWRKDESLEERAARYGLVLGELCGVSLLDGALYNTSKPDWFVVLVPGENGEGPVLERVVHTRTPESFFPFSGRARLDEVGGQVQGAISAGDPDQAQRWLSRVRECVDLGVAGAAEILAGIESGARGDLDASLAKLRDGFGSGTRYEQIQRCAQAMWSLADAMLRAPLDASSERQAIDRNVAALRERHAVDVELARTAGDFVAARALQEIQVQLGVREVDFNGSDRSEAATRKQAGRLFMCGWAEDLADQFVGKTLEESMVHLTALVAQGMTYEHPSEYSRSIFSAVQRAIRAGHADWCLQLARAAEGRDLPATALGYAMLAHGLTSVPSEDRFASLLPEWQRLREKEEAGEPFSPLDEMRKYGLLLAARLGPFVEGREAWMDFAFTYNQLFENVPFTHYTRVGLQLGSSAQQYEFADTVGAPMWRLEFGPLRLLSRESTWIESEDIRIIPGKRAVPSEGFADYSARVSELQERVSAAYDAMDAMRGGSTAYETETLEGWFSEGGRTDYRTIERETFGSELARGRRNVSFTQSLNEYNELAGQLKDLMQHPPPEMDWVDDTRYVTYPVHIQSWNVELEREISLVSNGERETSVHPMTMTLQFARVEADPANGIEARDDWIGEEMVQQRVAEDELARERFAMAALRQGLTARFHAHVASTHARSDLSEAERTGEEQWLRYLFSGRSDPETERLSPFLEQKLVYCAFMRPLD